MIKLYRTAIQVVKLVFPEAEIIQSRYWEFAQVVTQIVKHQDTRVDIIVGRADFDIRE